MGDGCPTLLFFAEGQKQKTKKQKKYSNRCKGKDYNIKKIVKRKKRRKIAKKGRKIAKKGIKKGRKKAKKEK